MAHLAGKPCSYGSFAPYTVWREAEPADVFLQIRYGVASMRGG